MKEAACFLVSMGAMVGAMSGLHASSEPLSDIKGARLLLLQQGLQDLPIGNSHIPNMAIASGTSNIPQRDVGGSSES